MGAEMPFDTDGFVIAPRREMEIVMEPAARLP